MEVEEGSGLEWGEGVESNLIKKTVVKVWKSDLAGENHSGIEMEWKHLRNVKQYPVLETQL